MSRNHTHYRAHTKMNNILSFSTSTLLLFVDKKMNVLFWKFGRFIIDKKYVMNSTILLSEIASDSPCLNIHL